MAVYGYARVSSADQDYSLQEHALRAAGCEVIRAEKASGTTPGLTYEIGLEKSEHVVVIPPPYRFNRVGFSFVGHGLD